MGPFKKIFFLQDGVICYKASVVTNFFEAHKIKCLGNSPDLNPNENTWLHMKAKLHRTQDNQPPQPQRGDYQALVHWAAPLLLQEAKQMRMKEGKPIILWDFFFSFKMYVLCIPLHRLEPLLNVSWGSQPFDWQYRLFEADYNPPFVHKCVTEKWLEYVCRNLWTIPKVPFII